MAAKPTTANAGLCCRAFPLSCSYAELMRAYDAWRAGHKTYLRDDGKRVQPPTDIHALGLILRKLGVFKRNPINGYVYPRRRELFSCVHLTGDGTCGIYKRRPKMCRDYFECEYPTCSGESGKAKCCAKKQRG